MSSVCHNIWAVGRNYVDHIKELGHQVPQEKTNPMIFLKAGSCVVPAGSAFHLPTQLNSSIHHEVEIALRINEQLLVDAYTIALDLTARETQNELKNKSHPWTLAKSFKNACPLGDWVLLKKPDQPKNIKEISEIHFSLKINGQIKQDSSTLNMIYDFQSLYEYILNNFPVVKNDIILTGTPQGVGPIHSGDKLTAEIKNIYQSTWTVL